LIITGEKTSTIRWHETRIELGPMMYVRDDDQNETVLVNVTRCTDMKLANAARFLGREADWPPTIMLESMREHYPLITLEDVVQIVEHDPPTTR